MKAQFDARKAKDIVAMTSAIANKVGCKMTEAENTKITVVDGNVVFSGFNHILRVDTIMPAVDTINGNATVGTKMLVNTMNSMDGTVSLSWDNGAIVVADDETSVKMKVGKVDDFPNAKPILSGPTATVKGVDFCAMLNRMIQLSEKDGIRNHLNGVNIAFDGDIYTMNASDGFIAGTGYGDIVGVCTEATVFTIPNEAVEVLVKYASKNDIVVYVTKQTSWWQVGDTTLIVENVIEQFPDMRPLFPTEKTFSFGVDYDTIINAANKADSILPNPENGVYGKSIAFDVTADGLALFATADGNSVSRTIKTGFTVTGETFKFELAIWNLKKTSKIFAKSKVNFDVLKASAPITVKSDDIPKFKVIIMPVYKKAME